MSFLSTETKLMEPYLSLRFDGPQDDDIRGAHRLYGDPYEVNGTVATATPIDLTNTNSGDAAEHGELGSHWGCRLSIA
jgi:hypothetical protein